jgi:hypothetical protein
MGLLFGLKLFVNEPEKDNCSHSRPSCPLCCIVRVVRVYSRAINGYGYRSVMRIAQGEREKWSVISQAKVVLLELDC